MKLKLSTRQPTITTKVQQKNSPFAKLDYPLDEFDYELSRRADEDKSTETISFDDVLQELGISYEDLQTN